MTPKTTAPQGRVRKLHANVLRRRRTHPNDFLLCDEDFRFAADCERMRVDRNGSMLSLLLIRLHENNDKDIAFFARLLEGRIRVTDTPGLLADGRIAILLPDTSAEGAWKVATDISEVYPPGPGRPECDVLVYPNQGRGRDLDSDSEFKSNDDDYDGSADNETPSERGAASSPSDNNTPPTNEFFFAKPHPLWKRAIDISGGLVGLVASAPIIAVAGLSVKATSRGPMFFRQEREGHGGRRFTMWKLRTMHVDAEAEKQSLREFSQQDGPAFKMRKDPRTTSVGKFLRWTSMDELPQFWNVVVGDMSLVGPRPLPTEESVACQDWQRRRLQVMPGMTCTWQVSERGNVSFDEWVRMDLRYAKKHSLVEDLRLMFLTLPSLLFQRGMR